MAGNTKGGQDPDHEHKGIAINLTSSQIDQVVRGAAGVGNMSVLLSGHIDRQEILAHESELLKDQDMSASLMRGLLIIAALPSDGSYIGVVELARALNLSASTTHRYLATLVRVGLVERDTSSRKYRLAK